MRVDIEKRHIDSYKGIAKDVNNALNKKVNLKVQRSKFEKILIRRDISAENKKKQLVKSLHELIISTFSVNINKVENQKKVMNNLKRSTELIRYVLHKIKSINNYIEEALLLELGIIKKSLIVKAVKSSKPEQFLNSNARVLTKNYIHKIENTVYELMHEIVIFDKKLIKNYKKNEIKVIVNEKVEIKDLENLLEIESELLDALEAKIPPSSKIKAKMFNKINFNNWVPMVLALLSSFEAEYSKERIIFSKIKNNDKLRKKIENKIDHVIKEKENILKIKEKRASTMESFRVSDDYRQTFHDYVSAASL